MCWPSQLWHSSLEFGKQLFQIDGNWNMSSVLQVSSTRSSTPVANSLSFKFRNQSHSANPIFLSRFLFLFFFFFLSLQGSWSRMATASMQLPCMIHTRWSICPTKASSASHGISSLSWPQTLRAHPLALLFGIKVSESPHSVFLTLHPQRIAGPLWFFQIQSDFSFSTIHQKVMNRFFFFQKVPTVALCPQFLAYPTLHLINYPASFVFSILSRHFCTFNWPCQHASDK